MTPRRAAALAAFTALLPLGTTADAAGDIAPTAAEVRPLRVGAAVPDVPLRQLDGRATTLTEQLAERPALVIFYRGGW
jgi:cytochrome oxidase Cu insertion factor (SCO1/SenC/PrrC family)